MDSVTQVLVVIAMNLLVPLAIINAVRCPEARPVITVPVLIGGISVVAAIWALGVPPWQYGFLGLISTATLSWIVGFVIAMATGSFQDYINELESM